MCIRDRAYIVGYPGWNKKPDTLARAEIRDGKFTLTGSLPDTMEAGLYITGEKTYAILLLENADYRAHLHLSLIHICYYRENIDYFYGGEGMYVLSIDEDVKSLGIPYNDKRLLDTAIRLLEKGKETEKANRILHRYTLCRFEAPQEWRTWYEKNKERLFFTESGGWLFMVNTREPDPANDYSCLLYTSRCV